MSPLDLTIGLFALRRLSEPETSLFVCSDFMKSQPPSLQRTDSNSILYSIDAETHLCGCTFPKSLRSGRFSI